MLRPIMRDEEFLKVPSVEADESDVAVGRDLDDTLSAHANECVGMAANMIGVSKRIIVVNNGIRNMVMYNPVIVLKSEPYAVKEGCLSLDGQRPTTRFEHITVTYCDSTFKEHTRDYSGFVAQIIQHEVDHCDGIII